MSTLRLARICALWIAMMLPAHAAAQADDTPEPTQQPVGDAIDESPPAATDEAAADPIASPVVDSRAAEGREHRGFYLRGTLGMGYGSGSVTAQDIDLTSSGFGTMLSVAIGGALVENLILNADLFIAYIFKPSVAFNDSDGDDSDATHNSTGLGLGLTYYIMPMNLYVAGSAGLGFVSVANRSYSPNTDMGWGVNAIVGKEWWIDERSGIGVAAQFMYVSAPETNVDARFDMYFVGISASVSYD